MKKINVIFVFSLMLMGCRLGPSSAFSSNLSSQIISSSILLPNSDFIPIVNNRIFLIEDIVQRTFAIENNGTLSPRPLAPINFPVTENVVTPYAPASSEIEDASEEVITWSNQPLSTEIFANNLTVGQSLIGEPVLNWLQSQQTTDEKWNHLTTNRKLRDLSHVYFSSDYYWFNHFTREEVSQIKRYDNEIVFGTGNVEIIFQTGVNISPQFAFQRHADPTTIYEIYDETYPVGFFGAQDYQYRTPRTLGNFKQALTLGPIQMMLDAIITFEQGLFIPRHPLKAAFENYQHQLSLKRISLTTFELTFQIFTGSAMENAEETFELKATIQDNIWLDFQQSYYLWKPIVS
jgi:hypothetical protein